MKNYKMDCWAKILLFLLSIWGVKIVLLGTSNLITNSAQGAASALDATTGSVWYPVALGSTQKYYLRA